MAGLAAFAKASAAGRAHEPGGALAETGSGHPSSSKNDGPPGQGQGDEQRRSTPQKKSPAFRRDLPLLSLGSRTSDPDRDSGSGPDPAAAGRAFARRPAADRASCPGSGSAGWASDPGSGSAGPRSDSGCSFGDSLV